MASYRTLSQAIHRVQVLFNKYQPPRGLESPGRVNGQERSCYSGLGWENEIPERGCKRPIEDAGGFYTLEGLILPALCASLDFAIGLGTPLGSLRISY